MCPSETEQVPYGHDRTKDSGQADVQPLKFMVLDVLEEPGGRFNIWGKTNVGQSVLVRISDFTPYFYMAQPVLASLDEGQASDFDQATCTRLQRALNGCVNLLKHRNRKHWLNSFSFQRSNTTYAMCRDGLWFCRHLSPDCNIQSVELVHRTPIMFFRPNEPAGGSYIKVRLPMAIN